MMPSPQLTENARRVLEARYLRRNSRGEIVETPEELFRRVARGIAAAEQSYGGPKSAQEWEERFFDLLCRLEFLPNSPTLMNAGTPLGQLSACFVLPVEDRLDGIFDSLRLMALIQQSGGGTGMSFSQLRPRGDPIATTGGMASGPVSFMRIFDATTDNIRQGGRRRGANMGILRADHPDIDEFIDAKRDGRSFRNFNLSVGATDSFLQAVLRDQMWELRHPRTGDVVGTRPASELLKRITLAAWETGDPGLIFLDTINRSNPTPQLGAIEATNPCGEVPLLPYEACNLGSINLSRMSRREGDRRTVDWEKLGQTVDWGVRFLDDVIEVGRWPDPRITDQVRGNRKIGLGVMGFAELLIQLGVPYASQQAVAVAEELMAFLHDRARDASRDLARQRGTFPNWKRSVYAAQGLQLRNATRTSVAPTGTIGIIAGTSASIEPLFAVAYRREHVLEDQTLVELNPVFMHYAQERGLLSQTLVEELTRTGTLTGIPGVPQDARSLFQTALEIPPEAHLHIQSAFQRHVDNAVAKTVNLPQSATAEEIATIYLQAWELGLKGVTVFRSGSKGQQVLNLGFDTTPAQHEHFAMCDPHACKL